LTELVQRREVCVFKCKLDEAHMSLYLYRFLFIYYKSTLVFSFSSIFSSEDNEPTLKDQNACLVHKK